LGKDVSDGKVANNKGALEIPLTKNSVIVADRYYFDSYLLNKWDASGFASGVYSYKLSTAQVFVQTRKLVLLK